MRTLSLTDVISRSMSGPNGGLRPADPAPPRAPVRPIELDYPHISTQPEYKAAADKLSHFAQQQADAEARLVELETLFSQATKTVDRTEEGAISQAEALLAGKGHDVNLQDEIVATKKRIDVLRNAIKAQRTVLHRVNQQLSRAAGRRYEDEHRQRVKRLMAALDELYAADQAEQALRYDLERLGYTGGTLIAMNFQPAENPHDRNGNVTYYWYREAKSYSKSAAEVAADLRKTRLTASLAE